MYTHILENVPCREAYKLTRTASLLPSGTQAGGRSVLPGDAED